MSERVAEHGSGAAWAFMVLAAAFLAAPACAELRTVGLDAEGVDVRATLRTDLDVRDAFNRPVSRVLVERQLALARAAADPSRVVSSLPLAQALWDTLNRVLLGVGLRGGRLPGVASWTAGLPWRLPKRSVPAAAALFAVIALAAPALRQRPASAMAATHPSRPLVLRC